MRKFIHPVLIVLAGLFWTFADAQQIYVAPDGNDANPGTKKRPLSSLSAARDAVRRLKSRQQAAAPVTVVIADGVYHMTEPLILTAKDGGTEAAPVRYEAAKGAAPVFSGGREITGFTVNDDGIWQVKIPECKNGAFRFDQLYVNGQRAQIARTPDEGYFRIGDVKQIVEEKGKTRVPERARQILSFDKETFNILRKIPEDELGTARFRAYHKWDFTLRYIDSLDSDSLLVFTTGRGMKPWNPLKSGTRIVFENFKAALDTPGEWFLDGDGTLFYYPRKGETPRTSRVVVPVRESLVEFRGDTLEGQFVEHIIFNGLTFSHCNYRMPPSGFEPNQAAVKVNAAVSLTGAKHITFEDCTISKTGQHALWFGYGCSQCTVRHCYLNDLGGGGIYLGNPKPLGGAGHTSFITLDNNIIQSGGREFPPAVGVWIGQSSDNVVTHNDIGDFYYTGVSVGWTWGYAPNTAKRNAVTYNHIHHIGWALLSDMAGVYTLGKSEGTAINNNVIHHINAYSYGGWGLYPDEGTSFIEMKNNLVYRTKTGGFHQHYGEQNVIVNNIFAYAQLYQLQCTRVEDHLSFTFRNNIVVFDEGMVLKGAWEKIEIKMDSNLYWNTGGDKYDFNGMTFLQWQETGRDIHSLIADPGFGDSAHSDFEIDDPTTVNRIGFIPFDTSEAGVYGNVSWKKKARLPEKTKRLFDEVVKKNLTQQTGRD